MIKKKKKKKEAISCELVSFKLEVSVKTGRAGWVLKQFNNATFSYFVQNADEIKPVHEASVRAEKTSQWTTTQIITGFSV